MTSTTTSPCLRRTVGGGVGLAIAAATITATASPAAAEDYVVQPGDTVSHIAARTGTTVNAIVSANNLDARATIRIGQVLTLPTAAPAPVAAAPAPAATTHTVVAGDTVSALAKRYGSTVQAIVAANGLDSRAFIRVGQTLTIPAAGATVPTQAGPAPAPAPTTATHLVVAGDTVSALAKRYGTTVDAIVSANGLDSRALIRIGQTLTIPGATTGSTTPAPAAPTATTTAHTVVSGDTVSALATRYGTTVDAIVSANGLDSRALIRIGQTLTIPGATVPQGTATSVGNTFAGRTYPAHVVAAANENLATLRSIGVPSKDEMRALVRQTAIDMGVDPALALAVAYQESGFNHASVSPANAIGTMQVIPTSGDWASDLVGRRLNLLDPRDNVVAGVAILRQLVRTAPDLPTAIAGYYQGLSSVTRNGMYEDTKRYVANVQSLMSRFA
jgi:LysM repeat protein